MLRASAQGLEGRATLPDSKAKQKKVSYHLYGKRAVSILGRKTQKTYVAGVIMQKHFVGFYFMPIYSHPKHFSIHSPILRKARSGKSCVNIRTLDAAALKEVHRMLKQGIQLYRREGWI